MRWLRHLLAPSLHGVLPKGLLDRVTAAITEGETRHGGQVMVAVEADLPLLDVWRGVQPRQRAEQAFAQLRTWDTEDNNGVLVYLLLADHAIEIVADRGLRGRVDPGQWQEVCTHLQALMAQGQVEAALVGAVDEVAVLLAAHYPPRPRRDDEDLPNTPQLIG